MIRRGGMTGSGMAMYRDETLPAGEETPPAGKEKNMGINYSSPAFDRRNLATGEDLL